MMDIASSPIRERGFGYYDDGIGRLPVRDDDGFVEVLQQFKLEFDWDLSLPVEADVIWPHPPGESELSELLESDLHHDLNGAK